MIEKKFSIEQEALDNALIVAAYQNRTFSNYVRHCVLIETNRRIKEALAKSTASEPSVAGKAP